MDVKIGTRWADVLESGRYAKGTGVLHELEGEEMDLGKDRFCCLGVLCRMAVEEGVEVETENMYDSANPGNVVMGYAEETGMLPRKIREWAGIATCLGSFPEEEDGYDDLAQLNDASEDWTPVVEAIREYMEVL